MKMDNVEINLLGNFEICFEGKNVLDNLGNSKKKLTLLQYLLVKKDTQFTNSNLFEHLWGDDDSTNPESALKTLVSRLRGDLKPYGLGDIIVTRHGVYQWNEKKYSNIDLYKFEKLANQLLTTVSYDELSAAKFEEAITMYKGDLLVGYDNESWIVPTSMYFHELYLKLVYKYIELLGEVGKHDDALRVARRGLEIDKYDTRMHLGIMNAMIALDMTHEAMGHYKYAVDLHHTQLGSKPPEDILNFYKKLVAIENTSTTTLENVSKELSRDDGDNTAFVCDYSIFKDIYKINMRNLQRLGVTIFLGMITLSSTSDEPTDSEMLLLDKVMGMLQATLKFNLRKGDTISRYGPAQFLVLLPTLDNASGEVAMERVKNAFYKNCTVPNFVLSYKLVPLGADYVKKKEHNYKSRRE